MSEAAYLLDAQTLVDLRNALGEFAAAAQDALRRAAAEIQRTREWLQERERYWRRRVEAARRAYEACMRRRKDDERDSCAAASAALRHAEAQLRIVLYWRRHVERAIGEYERYARRLHRLTTTGTARAQSFLGQRRAEVERYSAVGVPAAQSAVAALQDMRAHSAGANAAARGAVNALRNMTALKPASWRQTTNVAERLKVLQNVEQRIAAIQGRPAVEVSVKSMPPGKYGGYNRETKKISLAEGHIKSNDVREIVDTVVHEGRHAYQHYAVDNPGFHPDAAQVASWRDNFRPGNYLSAEEYGQEIYAAQPVETDAFDYAGEIVSSLFGGKND